MGHHAISVCHPPFTLTIRDAAAPWPTLEMLLGCLARGITHLVALAGVPVSNLLQQQVPAGGLIRGRVGSAHRPVVFSGETCRRR
jgi:hypothetical protein